MKETGLQQKRSYSAVEPSLSRKFTSIFAQITFFQLSKLDMAGSKRQQAYISSFFNTEIKVKIILIEESVNRNNFFNDSVQTIML